MKKVLTLALVLLLNFGFVINATDLVVNDFESGSPLVTTK